MTYKVSSGPPKGALPFLEAMQRHLPQDMWSELAHARDRRKSLPRRTITRSLYVRDDPDRRRGNEIAHQARQADATLKRTWAGMIAAMKQRLLDGELIAYAQVTPPFGEWRAIPSDAWHSLHIKDPSRGTVAGQNVSLTDVRITATEPVPEEFMPTGAPGAPTKGIALCVEEFERRAAAGDIELTVRRQGEVLREWFRETYPRRPAPTPGSIENDIRALYRKAKKAVGREPRKL